MMERLERVEAKIDRLETRFDALEAKVDEQGRTLGERIDEQGRTLGERIDEQGRTLGERIDEQGRTLGERIDAQGRKFDVQMEQMRGDLRTFAEALGGRLDALVFELRDYRREAEATFFTHGLALEDHLRRIRALEQSRAQ